MYEVFCIFLRDLRFTAKTLAEGVFSGKKFGTSGKCHKIKNHNLFMEWEIETIKTKQIRVFW
jgi:hypothetical protein